MSFKLNMTPKGQWLLSQPPLFGDEEAVLNDAGKHRTINPHAVELGTLELPPETQMWLCFVGKVFIAQNAYCSRDIYFQFKKVCRSVISHVLIHRR